MRSLNSSKGYPLEATKSKRTCSLQLPRKRRSRNSPLGVRTRSLLICSPESSVGSGGRACSSDRRIACIEMVEKIQQSGQYSTLIVCDHYRHMQLVHLFLFNCCRVERQGRGQRAHANKPFFCEFLQTFHAKQSAQVNILRPTDAQFSLNILE